MPFEQEPQFSKPKESQPFYETTEEVERKLAAAGVEKENIEAAILLMKQIALLDRRVFPDNPAAFDFWKKEHPLEAFAAFITPEHDEKERSYGIATKNLAKMIKTESAMEVSFFNSEGKRKGAKQFSPGYVFAAHEVRHRVQHDCAIKQFAPESAELVEDNLLRSIIKFQKIVFEEREKIYRRDKKSEDFIRKKLSPAEFDAEVIERLVGHRLNEIPKRLGSIGPSDLNELADILQMSAPEK